MGKAIRARSSLGASGPEIATLAGDAATAYRFFNRDATRAGLYGSPLCTAHGNYASAGNARTGVLVALGTAALAGSGVAWMNWLIDLGKQL